MPTPSTTAPRDLNLHYVDGSPARHSHDSLAGSTVHDGDDHSDGEHGDSSHLLQSHARRGISHVIRRSSFIDEEEEPLSAAAADNAAQQSSLAKVPPVTWRSLPKRGQLVVLTAARLSEPLTHGSLSAYMFYQLKSFDSTLPDGTIAWQGGMLTASFAAAQFLTAVWWGKAADHASIGRKRVLLVGLFGTTVSCIGVGFSRSFTSALIFRMMAGGLNGNVGVMRTMISEIIKEKKFQSRAFLLLPMCFNIGVVVGPILGGFLADPIESFPGMFGDNSILGGKNGVSWMRTFPYALPNLVNAVFITGSALSVVLGLDETHRAFRNKPDDYGRRLGKRIGALFAKKDRYEYTQLDPDLSAQNTSTSIEMDWPRAPTTRPETEAPLTKVDSTPEKLPFRKIFTSNVLYTLLAHFLLAFHISSFNALIFILLPAPRSANTNAHLPFSFTGGLGLSTEHVGLATAIIGIIGFPLQISSYPLINAKLGTLKCYRVFLPFSPIAYTLLPFLTLLPDKAYLIWPCLTAVLALQVISRTFTLPGAIILVNNSAPDPSVLGTIHGFAQSVSSAARTLGPVLGGIGLGWGLKNNAVGAVWWCMALVAITNWGVLWILREGGT
jgi:MFS family permease